MSAANGTGIPTNPPGGKAAFAGVASTLKLASRVTAHAAWTKATPHSAVCIVAARSLKSSAEQSGGARPNAIASARLSSCTPSADRRGSLPKRRANRPSNVSAMTARAIANPARLARPFAAATIAPTPNRSERYVSRFRRSKASAGEAMDRER